jgi:hypothetical protein
MFFIFKIREKKRSELELIFNFKLILVFWMVF